MKKFRRLTSAVLSAALALTCLSAAPLSAGAVDLTNKTPDIMIGHPDDFPQSNLTEVKSLEESDCTNVAELDGYYQMVDDPSGMLSGDHAVLLFIENKEGNEAIAQIKENGLSIKFSFTPDENGEYVFSPWATDPRGENWQSLGLAETVAYYNAWSVEVDGQAYDMTSYNAYEFAGFYLVKAFGDGVQLSAGTAYNITMTYKWNSTYGNRIFSAFDCIKVYKNANEKNTVCVDYNNYKADGNLQKVGNNRHWGVPAGEFADETGNDSQQRHLSYTVNCEEDGIYAIDYIASRQTGAYADAYGTHSITITNSKNEVQEYSQTSLYKQRISNIPGVGEEGAQEPATAPCLAEYKIYAKLTKGENTITFNINKGNQHWRFWLNSAKLYLMDKTDDNGNPIIEGEAFINPGTDLDGIDTVGIATSSAFGGNEALYALTGGTESKTVKYAVYAQTAGEYRIDFASGVLYAEGGYEYGFDFDITIGDNTYHMLNNTQRGENALSSTPFLWFQYVYNQNVHLDTGWNDIIISMNKRPAEGNDNVYFGLDRMGFSLQQAEDTSISVANWGVDGANINITLNNSTAEKPNVILAVYNSVDALKMAAVADGDGVNYRLSVPADLVLEKGDKAYIFVWNDSLKPYCAKDKCDLSGLIEDL